MTFHKLVEHYMSLGEWKNSLRDAGAWIMLVDYEDVSKRRWRLHTSVNPRFCSSTLNNNTLMLAGKREVFVVSNCSN